MMALASHLHLVRSRDLREDLTIASLPRLGIAGTQLVITSSHDDPLGSPLGLTLHMYMYMSICTRNAPTPLRLRLRLRC